MSCINTMKHFNYTNLLLACLLFLSACSSAELKWDFNGSVSLGKKYLKTNLDNTYSGLPTEEGLFLAGYKIDSQGINHPTAALVKQDLSDVTYWPQTEDIKQFFQYQQNVYLLSNTGQARLYQNNGWSEEQKIQLKENSIVIDSTHHITACTPAPLMKTAKSRGTCYSPDKGWDIDVSWSSVKPALCGKYITVIEDRAHKIKAHQIDTISGDIVRSIEIKTAVDDVCTVMFN